MDIGSTVLGISCDSDEDMDVLSMSDIYSSLHNYSGEFSYDKRCISQNSQSSYLYGKWQQSVGLIDFEVIKKARESQVNVFIPPRVYFDTDWDNRYEGYVLEGVTKQPFTNPNDCIRLQRLYHINAPTTEMQFYTKCRGTVHFGHRVCLFSLIDFSSFMFLLNQGVTLLDALSNDIVNCYASLLNETLSSPEIE